MVVVGACQTPEFIGDLDGAIACIRRFASYPCDVVLFPECFLQGYVITDSHVRRTALALQSTAFTEVLHCLKDLEPTLVVGLIEEDAGAYFNAAVVVERGRVIGRYRKRHLRPGESLFTAGTGSTDFDVDGTTFTVRICYDTQFRCATEADVILVPSQNMMRGNAAREWKDRHHEIRADRARESKAWLISADVTGERGDTHVGLGPTSVMNPLGEVVSQVCLGEVGITTVAL